MQSSKGQLESYIMSSLRCCLACWCCQDTDGPDSGDLIKRWWIIPIDRTSALYQVFLNNSDKNPFDMLYTIDIVCSIFKNKCKKEKDETTFQIKGQPHCQGQSNSDVHPTPHFRHFDMTKTSSVKLQSMTCQWFSEPLFCIRCLSFYKISIRKSLPNSASE